MTDTTTVKSPRLIRLEAIAAALEAPTAKGYKAPFKYAQALEAAGFLMSGDRFGFYVWGNGTSFDMREALFTDSPAGMLDEARRLTAVVEKSDEEMRTVAHHVDSVVGDLLTMRLRMRERDAESYEDPQARAAALEACRLVRAALEALR